MSKRFLGCCAALIFGVKNWVDLKLQETLQSNTLRPREIPLLIFDKALWYSGY
jgi:hypothetical protein